MAKATGVIEQISSKDVSTKFGVKQTWSMKIDGQWFQGGFVSTKNPKLNTGDEVEFDPENSAYGMEAKSIRVISRGVGTSTPPSAAPAALTAPPRAYGGGYKDRVFPVPPLHGDRSIVRQNALARATELMIHATGGKPYEVNDKVIQYIIKVARNFEAYTAGDLDLAEVTAEIERETEETETKTA